jgi:biotin transport system substrate-specific component
MILNSYLSQVQIASHVAIVCLLGLIPKVDLPFLPGVPITAQTLGVMLAGTLLSLKNSIYSMAIFLMLVLIGAPLLSGGRGGISVFFAPSAGYLFGWIIGAAIISLTLNMFKKTFKIYLASLLACFVGGIFIIHLCGILGLVLITELNFSQASYLSLAFVPGDIVKCFLAAFITSKILYKFKN